MNTNIFTDNINKASRWSYINSIWSNCSIA